MNKRVRESGLGYLTGCTALSIIITLYLIFIYVPTERTMGIVQRIFYFHLPSAWVAFLAFLVAFAAGIAYLLQRKPRWDMMELASVELGTLFSTIAIVTGSIWARPIWNTWWTWDPRLTSTLVMWLYYSASLMLRRTVEDPDRGARFGAVLSIVGFVNVPVVFLAIRLWRTIHPVLISRDKGLAMEPSMVLTLGASLVAFTLLYVCLLMIRMRAEYLRQKLDQLEQLVGSACV